MPRLEDYIGDVVEDEVVEIGSVEADAKRAAEYALRHCDEKELKSLIECVGKTVNGSTDFNYHFYRALKYA